MARRDAAAFLLDCGELRVLAASGLSGRMDASAVALSAAGLTLAGGPGHACLLHIPPALAGSGGGSSTPGIEILHMQRCGILDPILCSHPLQHTVCAPSSQLNL